MDEIEKKIMLHRKKLIDTDSDEFIRKLHQRIKISKANYQTLFTSSVIILTIVLLTITQFGAPDLKFDNYSVNSKENLIETDFWNINSESLDLDQEFLNNMAYFLIDEGYIWEAVELLDQFKLMKKEQL